MDFWHLLGDLHPKLVHIPLVLLLTGLAFGLAGMYTSPRSPIAGVHAQLLFRLSESGQPVTDLDPYIGAWDTA